MFSAGYGIDPPHDREKSFLLPNNLCVETKGADVIELII